MAETSTTPTNTVYTSLESIRLRKEQLQKDIQKDDAKIQAQWHSLFHRPKVMDSNAPVSKRLSSLLNTGAGALDAALLVWKLYRKFKK